jgi:SAM-dependent methyltransferase
MGSTMRLSVIRRAGVLIPQELRPIAKGALRIFPSLFKYQEEINFWRALWRAGKFENDYYEKTMLAIAAESNSAFLTGKIVADFGCGPKGSLCWATFAKMRIGIDVLADAYSQFEIRSQNMTYLVSTERTIPLPSGYVDVMFTMNAMDHVNNFKAICHELRRVLAPGGLFIGSFNLGEPPTFSEPQTLSESIIRHALLRHLDIETYRTAAIGPEGDVCRHFFDGGQPPTSGEYCLWVRAKKPIHAIRSTRRRGLP